MPAPESMQLTQSPARILQQYLIDQAVFGDPGITDDEWPLTVSFLPEGAEHPDDCGAAFDTQGLTDGRLMAGPVIMHHGVSIMVRAKDHTEGYRKASQVAALFETVLNELVTIDSETFILNNVSQTAPVVSVGQEPGKRRFMFAVNFLVTVAGVGAVEFDKRLALTNYRALDFENGVPQTLFTATVPVGTGRAGKIELVIFCKGKILSGDTSEVMVPYTGRVAWVAKNDSGTPEGGASAFADAPVISAPDDVTFDVNATLSVSGTSVAIQLQIDTNLETISQLEVYYYTIGKKS